MPFFFSFLKFASAVEAKPTCNNTKTDNLAPSKYMEKGEGEWRVEKKMHNSFVGWRKNNLSGWPRYNLLGDRIGRGSWAQLDPHNKYSCSLKDHSKRHCYIFHTKMAWTTVVTLFTERKGSNWLRDFYSIPTAIIVLGHSERSCSKNNVVS